MDFQGVVMNVAELDRSIDFYLGALGFRLLSREEQLAAVCAPGSDRAQIVVLREIGSSPMAGARHIGLRAFLLDVESAGHLDEIEGELANRKLLLERRERSGWTAVVGRDPDGVAVVVVWHPDGPTSAQDRWRTLDDFLYGIGE